MLAGNVVPVASVKSLSELLAVPKTLWCYTVFVAPVELVAKVQVVVAAHELCMASRVVEHTAEKAAAVVLNAVVENNLCVGSPIEYLLDLHAAGYGLPDGAGKHLL